MAQGTAHTNWTRKVKSTCHVQRLEHHPSRSWVDPPPTWPIVLKVYGYERRNAVMSAPPKNAPTAVTTKRTPSGGWIPAWLKGSKGSIKPLKSLKANMEQSFDELASPQIAEWWALQNSPSPARRTASVDGLSQTREVLRATSSTSHWIHRHNWS